MHFRRIILLIRMNEIVVAELRNIAEIKLHCNLKPKMPNSFRILIKIRAFLKRIAKLLAEEREKPYSTVRGFINS